jgi:hypothetical protein
MKRMVVMAALLAACKDSGSGDGDGGSSSDEGPPGPFALAFEEIAIDGDLRFTTELKFLPTATGEDPELLVLDKQGTVTHLRMREDAAERLGSFVMPNIHSTSDCGLISLALDPDFATNSFIYLGSCESQAESVIRRLEFTPGDYDAIPASAVEIIRVGYADADRPWHNVGAMGFDDTGAMWALFGDKHHPSFGQTLDDDLGAALRIIPSRGPEGGHEPAPDNPFIGMEGHDPDVYAYGFRSPWRGTIDSAGRLWIGDVGANDVEELNVVTEPGQNFGWGDHEGPCTSECDGLRQPVTSWPHDEVTQYMLDDVDVVNTTLSVVWVGLEHRPGADDPYDGELAGKMLFGDFCYGYIRTMTIDDDGVAVADTHVGHLSRAAAWDQGPDGFLYAVTFGTCTTTVDDPVEPNPSRLWRAVRAR